MILKSPGDSVVCGVYNSYWEKISNRNTVTVPYNGCQEVDSQAVTVQN